MSRDLNESESGWFKVKVVKPTGTYDSATLTASEGGSIHVHGTLRVNGPLTLVADEGGTILLPNKVTCTQLKVVNSAGSTINSNDLEVNEDASGSTDLCQVDVSNHSTAGLYMVLAPDQTNGPVEIGGRVTGSSTFNLWLHLADGGVLTDTVTPDHSSLYARRGWNGPA